MATIKPSRRDHELRLADADPEVMHSGSGDRFTVKFTMEGAGLLELENVLKPRLAPLGVERISRFGLTMSLYGVEAGREGEVFHEVQTAIEDLNDLREAARDDRERSRGAREAAEAVAEGRLDKTREAFHAARQSRNGDLGSQVVEKAR